MYNPSLINAISRENPRDVETLLCGVSYQLAIPVGGIATDSPGTGCARQSVSG